jgi:cytochrome c oxidase subunit I+III
LEWISGNAAHGFRSIVPITSRYPVWEQKGFADDGVSGRGFLPDAPTLSREALITSPITAEPEQILRMPGPTWITFLAAVATATALGAMTIKAPTVGLAAGIVAAGFYLYWLWSLDLALPREPADAGRGIALPLYRNGKQSVGWWGMVVLLISDAVVGASFAFAYLFFWTIRPSVWPPDGSELSVWLEPALVSGLVLAAYFLFEIGERLNRRDRRLPLLLCLLAAAILSGSAIVVGSMWLHDLGIDSTQHAYGASVWTLFGYVALHAAMGALMALWCVARVALGMIDSWRCLTLRICLLWWRFTAPVAVMIVILIAGFPYVVS